MFSVTDHRDRTCLTADDVEGLHFLYPMCEGAIAEPQCVSTAKVGAVTTA